jgi:hypothetical protein
MSGVDVGDVMQRRWRRIGGILPWPERNSTRWGRVARVSAQRTPGPPMVYMDGEAAYCSCGWEGLWADARSHLAECPRAEGNS